MRDVLVIGGGLTGLAACYQLEKLGLRCTVIELRRRFGGQIHSIARGGFIMDTSAFAFWSLAEEPWLPELGLSEQIIYLDDEGCIFRCGTESLIRALADTLQGGRLTRMAVSSIGRLGSRFTICLENGLMLDAGAIVLAAPARFAARMLYNLAPQASERLLELRHEPVWHVALGLHKRDLPSALPSSQPGAGLAFCHQTARPPRVPDGDHVLIQLGLRAGQAAQPAEVIQVAASSLGLSAPPIASYAKASWASLSIEDDSHAENMRLIRALLPTGISLAGSEYLAQPPKQPGLAHLAERINAGREAAMAAFETLKANTSR